MLRASEHQLLRLISSELDRAIDDWIDGAVASLNRDLGTLVVARADPGPSPAQ